MESVGTHHADREMRDIRGMAMFIVPVPEVGILETKVVRVGDLDYVDTRKRAETCVGFKWLPCGCTFGHGGEQVTVSPGDGRKPWICFPTGA